MDSFLSFEHGEYYEEEEPGDQDSDQIEPFPCEVCGFTDVYFESGGELFCCTCNSRLTVTIIKGGVDGLIELDEAVPCSGCGETSELIVDNNYQVRCATCGRRVVIVVTRAEQGVHVVRNII